MTQLHAGVAIVNYGDVLSSTENVTSGPREPVLSALIELGEAVLVTYQVAPEIMNEFADYYDNSGETTPVNTWRPDSVAVAEASLVDMSDELVFFEKVYRAFATETV